MHNKRMQTPSLLLIDDFFADHDTLFSILCNTVQWDERMRARKTASFGKSYDYSGMSYPEAEFPAPLVKLLDRVEQQLGYRPNNCLMNYYEDGSSTMGYHSDDTSQLCDGTGVSIVSLGGERHLWFREIQNTGNELPYCLKSGSLLHMGNDVQADWMHAVKKEAAVTPRISLTLRQLV